MALSRRDFLKTAAATAAASSLPVTLPGCGSTAGPTLEEKIAQMLVVGFRGTELTGAEPIARDLRDLGIGGVVLYGRDVLLKQWGRNVTSPEQLAALTAQIRELARTPPFVSVDQEGGNVARLKPSCGFPASVTAQYLGEVNDFAVTRLHATSIAATLWESGIDLNFAPVVDVNVNPDSPAIGRYGRSFSADPVLVVGHAGEFVQAHERLGVLTALKHFPGHGSSTADSHEGFVDVTATWSEMELQPFHALVEAGRARMVMTAHVFNGNLDPAYPATLSHATVTGLLRERMGYRGVVITDDMQMGAIVQRYGFDAALRQSIEAGVDMVIVANNLAWDPDVAPRNVEALAAAVRAGEIAESRIDASYARIQELKGLRAPR